MDLNRLREQLQKSKPVHVTRRGELRTPDGEARRAPEGAQGPSRIKKHTFARSA